MYAMSEDFALGNTYSRRGTVIHVYNPSTCEYEARGLRINGQLGPHSKEKKGKEGDNKRKGEGNLRLFIRTNSL